MSARNGVRARKNKERSKNFTELEKRTVLELINQHREVLRQGRSNNATNKSKQLVWSQICAEVNKRCKAECPRTPAQVKMWYENYKKKCKMRFVEPGAEESPSVATEPGLIWQNVNPLPEQTIKDTSILDMVDENLPINMSSDRYEDKIPHDMDSKEAIQLVVLKDHPPLSISRSSALSSPHVKSDSPSLDPRPRIPTVPAHLSNSFIVQREPSNIPLNLTFEPSLCFDDPSPNDEIRGASPSYSNLSVSGRHVLPSSLIFPNKKHPKPRGAFSRAGNSQDVNCCDKSNVSDASAAQTNHGSNNNNNNNGGQRDYYCSNASPTDEEKLYYLTKRQHAIYEHDLRMKTLNMELKYKEEMFSLQKQLFLIELKLKMDFLEKNCNQ